MDTGIVYLIQPTELIGTNRYKIGCSSKSTLNRCTTGYRSGTRFISIAECKNPFSVEKKIKAIFNYKFTLVAGYEYFEGDENIMFKEFNKIIEEHKNISSKLHNDTLNPNNKIIIFEYTKQFNNTYFLSLDNYNLQKTYFELFFCKVMRPDPLYIYNDFNKKKGSTELYYYTETKLKKMSKHISNFIGEWIKDPLIKVYNDLIFKPFNGIKYDPPNMKSFNSFSGYSTHIKTPVTDNNIIKNWCDIVLQLCENNKIFYDYYINFLAHIIQFPSEKINVSIIFKGNSFLGKSDHLIGIKNIITKKYCFSSSSKDDFIGKDAKAHINTLLVNWNEHGYSSDMIDKIKSENLREDIIVKNSDTRITNYARLILTTNNSCPLPISNFVIFQCTDHFADVHFKDNTFWDRFHETIYKPEFIAALYNYLNNIDLKNWNYKDFPKTSAYNQMRLPNLTPEILFVIDKIKKLKKDINVKGTILFGEYCTFIGNYLDPGHITYIKRFYAKLDNLKDDDIMGIDKCNVSGGVIGYSFRYDVIVKSLENKNIKIN
jgi:hypothetical protein